MQTFNSFNELAAAQTAAPLQSQMSVFNFSKEQLGNIITDVVQAHDLLLDASTKIIRAHPQTEEELAIMGKIDAVAWQADSVITKLRNLKKMQTG